MLNGREILDIKFKIILFLTCDHIHPQLRYKLSKIDKNIYFVITKTNKYSTSEILTSKYYFFNKGIFLDWIYLAATPLSTCFTDNNRRGHIDNDGYIDRFQRRSISVMMSQLTETSTVCFIAGTG